MSSNETSSHEPSSRLTARTERRLRIHTSNRLEHLVDRFAAAVAVDPPPPLEREIVLVQSLGMSRWLTLELARRNGLSANLSTPFPLPFVRWLARRVLDGEHLPASEEIPRRDDSPWGRDHLAWRLFGLLGNAADPSVGNAADPSEDEPPDIDAPLVAYLRGDVGQRKRQQLAARLAILFDGYQTFRPWLLRAWSRGELEGTRPDARIAPRDQATAAWQAQLWRRLLAQGSDDDRRPDERPSSERLLDLVARLETTATLPVDALPRRLTVFGASTLPPAVLDLLVALARFVPVSIDFVSPTHHYWADLRSEREQARLRQIMRRESVREGAAVEEAVLEEPLLVEPVLEDDDDRFEVGNSLLAALGRQGRDFFDLLQQADATGAAWHELAFVDPLEARERPDEPARALDHLQADILHLVDRGRTPEHPPLPPPADLSTAPPTTSSSGGDGARSLEVHVCHAPSREMEVLRDRLLAAFAADPTLRPSDVLVLVPDIELYGPFVQAVFGVEHEDRVRLPFSIADRGAGRERPPAETLLDLLQLVSSRLPVRAVFDLLDVPAVRRAAALSQSDLPRLRRLVDQARVRWGVDGAQRHRDFGVPPVAQSSWRAGLDRLLLGYAVGDVDALLEPIAAPSHSEGIVPLAGDTAGDAEALGRFALFLDTLFGHLERLRHPRPLEAWSRDLLAALDDLFEAEGEAEELGLQLARDACAELAEAATLLENTALERTALERTALERTALENTGFENITPETDADDGCADPQRGALPRTAGKGAGGPSPSSATSGGCPTTRSSEAERGSELGFGGETSVSSGEPHVSSGGMNTVELPALRQHLDARLRARSFSSGFLDGRITFAKLEPMRSIPFRVVALCGLDDGAFPRRDIEHGFDLMRRAPRRGDRSARDDDRYLFLEMLLAARDKLLLSTVGRSQRDGSERAPSPILAELLDHLERTFAPPPGAASILEQVVTVHPLQPWSPTAFDTADPGRLSASLENLRAARGARAAVHDGPTPRPPFAEPAPAGLPRPAEPATDPPDAAPYELSLETLVRFWRAPCAAYCRHLGLHLEPPPTADDESEAFAVGGLDGYAIRADMLARRLAAGAPTDLGQELALLQGRGLLPPGPLGAALHRRLHARVEALRARVPQHRALPPLPFELEGDAALGPWRLAGRLRHLADLGALHVRCGPLRPRDMLRAWLEHLVLAALDTVVDVAVVDASLDRASANRGIPRTSSVVAEDVSLRLPQAPTATARGLLGVLVDGLRLGLDAPLPIFERTSHDYVAAHLRAADPTRAGARRSPLDIARATFLGQGRPRGMARVAPEADDPAVRQVFRPHDGGDPLALAAFDLWSRRLWQPLLQAAGTDR